MKKKDEGNQQMPKAPAPEAQPTAVESSGITKKDMLKYAGDIIATDGKKILGREKATPEGWTKLISKLDKLGLSRSSYDISCTAVPRR